MTKLPAAWVIFFLLQILVIKVAGLPFNMSETTRKTEEFTYLEVSTRPSTGVEFCLNSPSNLHDFVGQIKETL